MPMRRARPSFSPSLKVGSDLVFSRLWEDLGIGAVGGQLRGRRQCGFSLERAIYLTMLHRLFVIGSDRAAWVIGVATVREGSD